MGPAMTCPHPLLRMLGGGTCPECARAPLDLDSAPLGVVYSAPYVGGDHHAEVSSGLERATLLAPHVGIALEVVPGLGPTVGETASGFESHADATTSPPGDRASVTPDGVADRGAHSGPAPEAHDDTSRGAHSEPDLEPEEGNPHHRPVRVYLIGTRDGTMVKVGKTIDLDTRFAALQRESPEVLELLAVLDGPPGLERLVHGRINRHRDRTQATWRKLPHASEWFRREGPVAELCTRAMAGETTTDLFAPAEVERVAQESAAEDPAYLRASLDQLERAEAQRLLAKLDVRAMRESLAEFVKGAWHVLVPGVPLEWSWHHDAICDHVQAMLEDWDRSKRETKFRQRITDLVFNVCPSSLKSKILMVFAPAWWWIDHPAWSVLCSSGNASNVERDSLECRDLVTSAWYRGTFAIAWQIRADLDRVAKWALTSGGLRESRAMGSSFTGIHVDALFLDDPDDAAKVWGEAARRDTWTSYRSMGNRLNNLKRPVRIVAQQNLHEADLSSRLVAELGYHRLALPAEFEPDRRHALVTTTKLLGWSDPRKTKGEALHAIRFTPEVLAAERVRLGSHGFEAQYNCNPSPLDGGMIARAWWRFFRLESDVRDRDWTPRPRPTGCVGSGGELGTIITHPAEVLKRRRDGRPELEWLTISVDATFGSVNATASAVGLLCVGGQKQRRFVFDDRTLPMTFLDTVRAIKAMIAVYPADRVLIELKANGDSVIESLRLELADGTIVDNEGKPVVVVLEPIGVEGGKESRAAAMVPAIEAGLVYLLEGAAWLDAFVGEVSSFPNAKRDDRVDALSQLMTRYRAISAAGDRARMQNVL